MKLSQKLKLLIWPSIYFVLIIAVCVSAVLAFNKSYYSLIFVSGGSMQPTLNNYDKRPIGYKSAVYVDYGKIDSHKKAIDNLKRFDIVTTYYPWSNVDYENVGSSYTHDQTPLDSASYKIKRVLALPFETISIDNSVVHKESITITTAKGDILTYDDDNLPFTRNRKGEEASDRRYRGGESFEITLGENEYWVMGDNWRDGGKTSSDDCFPNHAPIYYENITGVLVSIQGFARCYIKYFYRCSHCHETCSSENSISVCPHCHLEGTLTSIYSKEFIRELHRYKTRYF